MGRSHILIVEDNEAIATLEKQLLEKESYKVEIASQGFDALKKIREKEYDLIISDFSMPGMSGDEFYYEVKKMDKGLEKKIIFVTGLINDFILSTGNKYIAKPFLNKLFLETIKDFISSQNTQHNYNE